MPSVSVVIPVYNRPLDLLIAVASVARQTHPIMEIIVVDDASTRMPTGDELQRLHKAVRLVRLTKNSGASVARQTGIDAASGEYLAFLDSDDFWLPCKIADQMAALAAHGDELTAVTCGWVVIDPVRNTSYGRIPHAGREVADFASGCWFSPGSTAIVPRKAFDVVGAFDPELRRLEDLDWYLRFSLAGGQLLSVNQVGAVIGKSTYSNRQEVWTAADRILSRARGTLSPREQSRLKAYLALEKAVAAKKVGRYEQMVVELGRSFAAFPRMTLRLSDHWTVPSTNDGHLQESLRHLEDLKKDIGNAAY